VLSFILGLVFIIVGFVALKADTDRGAGINFRPNKMRCCARVGEPNANIARKAVSLHSALASALP
jgi:hypothetical protein